MSEEWEDKTVSMHVSVKNIVSIRSLGGINTSIHSKQLLSSKSYFKKFHHHHCCVHRDSSSPLLSFLLSGLRCCDQCCQKSSSFCVIDDLCWREEGTSKNVNGWSQLTPGNNKQLRTLFLLNSSYIIYYLFKSHLTANFYYIKSFKQLFATIFSTFVFALGEKGNQPTVFIGTEMCV